MHITFIMILLTAVNARKQLHDFPRTSKRRTITSHNEEANQIKFQLPVDFKYLSRQGVGDNDFKQPIDALRFRMIKLRDADHAIQSVQKRSPINTHRMPKKEPLIFLSPRDEMEYYKNVYNSTNKTTNSRPIDFSSILENNLADPFANRRGKILENQNTRKIPTADNVMRKKYGNITNNEYFQENRFYRKPGRYHAIINWTTCEEFAKDAVFHPDDIVNTKWLPFFIWSRREFVTTVKHTFSYPTKKKVQYFKTTLGPYYKNIDWTQPKLLLNERRNILLIAGDRKGLFYGIPDQELPKRPSMKNIILPAIILRLKLHDPYLAMMYCDEYYAAIMAELGTEPNSEHEAHLEAATLNFKGIGRTVRRDINEEITIANFKQQKKMEDEANKFIRIYKPTGDVDIKVRHA